MPLFSPESAFVRLWNFIIFFVITCKIFEIPFVIAFSIDKAGIYTFDSISLFIFLLEIVLSFNIGFYEEGGIVLNRKKIKKHYKEGKMRYDIFTTFFVFLSMAT